MTWISMKAWWKVKVPKATPTQTPLYLIWQDTPGRQKTAQLLLGPWKCILKTLPAWFLLIWTSSSSALTQMLCLTSYSLKNKLLSLRAIALKLLFKLLRIRLRHKRNLVCFQSRHFQRSPTSRKQNRLNTLIYLLLLSKIKVAATITLCYRANFWLTMIKHSHPTMPNQN